MSIDGSVFEIPLDSSAETIRLGQVLSRLLTAGDTVALSGQLGAGKTTLVRGILLGLGADPSAASPTFNILHIYETTPPLYHFDAWRFRKPEEFLDIGGEEYLDGSGIAIIEWAEKIAPYLPTILETVDMTFAGPGRHARITFSPRKIMAMGAGMIEELDHLRQAK
ncbi:MAG: tRNA (adenosine(37)-N6)-threonylcarbamoyltransferase complex ATPase subunit type 1 TsaE [Candidatus Brocadiia bacterium]